MIEWISALIGVFVAGFIVLSISAGLVLETQCPRCKKFFARESIRREIWSRWTGPERTERYYYRCKYCNHGWEEEHQP